jgi:hypothetical protein
MLFLHNSGVLQMRGGLQMLQLTDNYHNFVSKVRSQKAWLHYISSHMVHANMLTPLEPEYG